MKSYAHAAVVISVALWAYTSEVPEELNTGTRLLQDSRCSGRRWSAMHEVAIRCL